MEISNELISEKITIEEIKRTEQLVSLQEEWGELLSRSDAPTPFCTWIWVNSWWKNFQHDRELHTLLIRERHPSDATPGRLLGIAPFYIRFSGGVPIRIRTLTLLGAESAFTERHDIIAAKDKRHVVTTAVAEYLIKREGELWDIMEWEGVGRDDLPTEIADKVESETKQVYSIGELATSWETFFKSLNPSMRRNLRYYPRLIHRHGHQSDARIVSDASEVEFVVREFLRLHQARAEMAGGEQHMNRFDSVESQLFLRETMLEFAKMRILRAAVLTIDGQTASVQLTFLHNDTLYVYYSGFDPRWRKYAPSAHALSICVRHGIESGARKIDFLSFMAPYKRSWGAKPYLRSETVFSRSSVFVELARGVRHLKRQFHLFFDR